MHWSFYYRFLDFSLFFVQSSHLFQNHFFFLLHKEVGFWRTSGFSVKRFIIIGFVLKKADKKSKFLRVREEKMMEGSSKKKTKPDPFTDTVFSWSIEDIFNEDLFKDKVFDSTFTNKNLIFLFLLRKVVSICDYVPLPSFWLLYLLKFCWDCYCSFLFDDVLIVKTPQKEKLFICYRFSFWILMTMKLWKEIAFYYCTLF